MGNTALCYYWGSNPAFTFGTALPFGLNTRPQISWLLWGGGQDMINDLLKEYSCCGIPTGSTGAQMSGWLCKEIKSPEDLKCLKFRVGDWPAPSSRRSAVRRSRLRRVTSIRRSRREKLGFVKVAKYYLSGWWEGTGQGHNVINLKKWNALAKP